MLPVFPEDGKDDDGQATGEVEVEEDEEDEEEEEAKETEVLLVRDSRMLFRWCTWFARADRETEEDVEAAAVKEGETCSGCSSSSWVMGSWEPKE